MTKAERSVSKQGKLLASLSFKGEVTKQTAVNGLIAEKVFSISINKRNGH